MRRILLLLLMVLFTIGIRMLSANIKLLHTIPENGSEISTFDIKLKFDISEAIAESGNEDIAIGYTGSSRNNTKLYDGTPDSGTLITTVLTKTLKGDASSKDYIDLNIPSSFVPEPGHTYSIVFGNPVAMYDKNKTTVANSVISYNNEPITFTFYGAKASSEELLFQTASVANNDNIESLSSLIFEFNEDIAIAQNKNFDIYNGEELIASSKSFEIDPSNSKALKVTFDNVTLYLGKEYTIKLSEGVVSLKSNSTVVNKPVEIKVNGASTIKVSTKSFSIENNSVVMPNDVRDFRIEFNLESGQTLTPPSGIYHKRWINFYKGEISEGSLINRLVGTANEDGITWDLSTVSFEPSTNYILYLQSDGITVWVDGKEAPAYGNEEVVINFTTPSIEDLNLLPITVGATKIGRFDDDSSPEFVNGGTYAHINTIEIKREDYKLNGNIVKPNLNWDGEHNAYVYDVTVGSRKLVKCIEMFNDGRGGDDDGGLMIPEYSVFGINLNMDFLQDHMYEIVVPKGALRLNTVQYPSWYYYVMNDEIVYKVKGATPSEFKVESCSVINNAEVSKLPGAIIWTINGTYALKNNNVFADCKSTGSVWGNAKCPLTIQVEGNKSYVAVQLFDRKTGNINSLVKGQIYNVTIPAGSIVYPGDELLTNPKLTVTLNGIEAEKPEPEFVNTTITLADEEANEAHSFVVETVKGYPAKIQMLPGDNWNVVHVAHEGKSMTAVNGFYTSEPLTEDSKIVAKLKYTKEMNFDETSGIYTVDAADIKVFAENGHIVVDGLTEPTDIAVFTVGGIRIKSLRSAPDTSKVTISVAPNEIYIVVINGQAAKLKL